MIFTTECKTLVKPIVFLDIGDTLITSGPNALPPHKQIIKVYNEYGREYTPDPVQVHNLKYRLMTQPIGPTFRSEISSILGVPDDAYLQSVLELVIGGQIINVDYVDGAVEFIQKLNMCCIEYHLVSNIWEPYYHGFMRLYAQHINNHARSFLSYAVGVDKPSSKFYAYACNSIGAESDDARRRIITIGDSYGNDMLPAISKKMKTCWLLHRPEKEAAFVERVNKNSLSRPDMTVSSIANVSIDDLINLVN